MKELIEELEYNQKINVEKGLENRVDIDYILERLKNINFYFEVARYEVETAKEDILNDDLYKGYEDRLGKLSDEDINRIAWKVEDCDVWSDVYDTARNEVYNEIGVEDDEY